MPSQSNFTFSLATLMFVTTLIAVDVGLCVSVPWLGIPLALLTLPAWFRTVGIVKLRSDSVLRTSAVQQAQIFIESLALALLFTVGAISGAIALMGICISLASCFSEPTVVKRESIFEWLLWTAGSVVVAAGSWLAVILWPRKRYVDAIVSSTELPVERPLPDNRVEG